jgi:hypothetical protein
MAADAAEAAGCGGLAVRTVAALAASPVFTTGRCAASGTVVVVKAPAGSNGNLGPAEARADLGPPTEAGALSTT